MPTINRRLAVNATTTFSGIVLSLLLLVTVFGLSGCQEKTDHHAMHQSENGEPVNYLVYDEAFSSAGMPDGEFIKRLANEGVDIVVNVAPHSASGALANEAELVAESSMSYLNIAVDWNAPTQSDVDEFLSFMQANRDANVFLHCQMNMRATAFAMLHRVINEQVEPASALADMHKIWTPNDTWAQLMNEAFERHNVDYKVVAAVE